MNPVDEWISLLGLSDDAGLARQAGGVAAGDVEEWRVIGIPVAGRVRLLSAALKAGIEPADPLLQGINPVEEWRVRLGLRRDRDLAKVVGRHSARASAWRTGGIPPEIVLELMLYAMQHRIRVPERLLRSYHRRKDTERRLPSGLAA